MPDSSLKPARHRAGGTRGILVKGHRGVPDPIVQLIRARARILNHFSPVRGRLSIRVVPGVVVQGPDGGYGWGMFHVARGSPYIVIPGLKPDDTPQHDWLVDMLWHTLAHEWAHYEQWRDGKPVQERGVAVRARNLMRAARGDGYDGSRGIGGGV